MFLFYVLSFSKKGDTIQGGTLFKKIWYMFFVPVQFNPISSSVQWSCMVEIQDQGMEVRMRAHHTSISFECVAPKQTNTSSTYYYTT